MKASPLDAMPNVSTTPEAWAEWYDSLKDYFGRQVADQVWIRAWGIYGGESSPANTSALRDAMAKNDITIDSSGLSQGLDAIRHTAGNVTGFFGDVFQMGKYATFAIVGIGVLGTGILVWGLVKNPHKTIETGSKAAAMAI